MLDIGERVYLANPKPTVQIVEVDDCGLYCGIGSTMEIIQIVLDKKLLQATDQAARRARRNRSALVREALREHLQRLEISAREERDREGYLRQPQSPDESRLWEAEAAWPAE